MEQDLLTEKPALLVLCPPCTNEGGWMHLNSSKWDRMEYLKEERRVVAISDGVAACFKCKCLSGEGPCLSNLRVP